MIFLDFLINILPASLAKKFSFIFFGKLDYCFLVHARDYNDLYKKFPLLKYLPNSFTKFFGRILFPIRVGFIHMSHKKSVKGVFVGSPMDAKDMLNDRALAEKKIIKAAKFAEKLGVRYIGLGALNASLTKNGIRLVNHLHCSVTTGHSLTAWIVSQNAIAIQNLTNKRLTVAIVGAAGSIGSSCFKILKDHFDKFILIDKDLVKLKTRIDVNDKKILLCGDILSHIYQADIVITATNSPYAVIEDSSQLSEGTVVIDDAQPLNASVKVNSDQRKTLVIEGGVCHLDGLRYGLNLNFLDRGDMFSCMGEVLTLAALNSDLVTIGDTNVEDIQRVAILAQSLNIERARFRSFGKYVSEEYIKNLF